MKPDALFHFSEDPHIERFGPHVPHTNLSHAPAVWAIDRDHAPLYWLVIQFQDLATWDEYAGLAEAHAYGSEVLDSGGHVVA